MGPLQRDLVSFSEYVFNRTRERLADLTDEELAWEPTDWTWSVRPAGEGWQVDYVKLPVPTPPFSTIAWRLDHYIAQFAAQRNATWLGVPDMVRRSAPATGSVASELARLDDAAAHWHDILRGVDDDSLLALIGPIAGEYAESTRLGFVYHELDEMIHHAAEIGVLRDLYRARTSTAPVLDTVHDAAAHGRWDHVVELAEAGADVNGGGTTALHHAASVNATHAVDVLLAHGADPTLLDPQFHYDAAGWARYFGNDDLAARLAP
jgi:hypothetical protein